MSWLLDCESQHIRRGSGRLQLLSFAHRFIAIGCVQSYEQVPASSISSKFVDERVSMDPKFEASFNSCAIIHRNKQQNRLEEFPNTSLPQDSNSKSGFQTLEVLVGNCTNRSHLRRGDYLVRTVLSLQLGFEVKLFNLKIKV